ncbi:MAG: 2-dehydro-3-deoxy-6-phosphogalactonate aldolase [Alphaproteobacteria bacterium]|nr:MAG: 2-dehydro-3-deoxy-6-phosphogalactonate aldolase [Alphaproteobacteria bacterium]
MTFEQALSALPLVAILRGVEPDEVVPIADALIGEGFRLIEVPLNSPRPLESIRRLADAVADGAVIGAGTVTSEAAAEAVVAAGGTLIVMPHSDPAVIRTAAAAGATVIAGVFTATEAFAALAAGAAALKLFPAEAAPPPVLRALRAVLPPGVPILPVGGIGPETMAGYRAAGAAGFGLGSALYRPGESPQAVAAKAHAFCQAWRAL